MDDNGSFSGHIGQDDDLIDSDLYRNISISMLASGIKVMRIQLRLGSALPGSIFMRRRL